MSALVSQVYSYGRRNNTAKHFQLICLGYLFWGGMDCSHVMLNFLLTMTKGDEPEEVRYLTFKHLRIDVLFYLSAEDKNEEPCSYSSIKLSMLKQSVIRLENVRFAQNFIFN